jgi:hypothetical protein
LYILVFSEPFVVWKTIACSPRVFMDCSQHVLIPRGFVFIST